MSTYLSVESELRAEAEQLLARGVRNALESYGDVHLMGSYALELMTWRDLDIHLVREPLNRGAFFTLGERLADLLRPHRMQFRDETVAQTPGLPRGLYWGVYLGDEREGAWKIDVWATTPAEFEPSRQYHERLLERLTPETRQAILSIKSECWRHPHYRRDFTSADIYEAVLDRGVRSVEGFWLQRRVFLQ